MKYKLVTFLNQYNLKSLKQMAKDRRLRGYFNARKGELVSALAEEIVNPIYMQMVLESASEKEIQQLEQAMKEKVVIDPKSFHYHYWKRQCWAFVALDGEILIPEEIEVGYQKIMSDSYWQERIRRAHLIESYALACTNLYGIIDLETFTEIINSQNEDDFQEREIETWCIMRGYYHGCEMFCYQDGYLMSDCYGENGLVEAEDYHAMLDAQQDKPYYIPKRKELLNYVDHLYVDENAAFKDLLWFMKKTMKIRDVDAYDYCADIQFLIRNGSDFQDIFHECNRWGVTFENDKQLNGFVKYLTILHNNTRIPENRGYTPNEIRKVLPDTIDFNDEVVEKFKSMGFQGFEEPSSKVVPFPEVRRTAEKIYPNDPCPCGSGKKYKKCCGKNK